MFGQRAVHHVTRITTSCERLLNFSHTSLNADFPERDLNARIQDCGKPTVGGCEGVDFLFASELISFVSRPDTGQIAFQNRARLLVTEPFVDAFFERVQTAFSYFIENTN
jgi:hypothetical protein